MTHASSPVTVTIKERAPASKTTMAHFLHNSQLPRFLSYSASDCTEDSYICSSLPCAQIAYSLAQSKSSSCVMPSSFLVAAGYKSGLTQAKL